MEKLMLKRILLIAAAATLPVLMGYADQTNPKVTIPIQRTTPTSGKQMFTNYCAPCHGADARGRGPVAPALKMQPSDLTVLSKNNRGKFPDAHIVTVLENGANMPSHGSAEMPVWGPILAKMDVTNPQDRLLRISNLSRYLDTLQVK
jgi:mono/diheme cytochrome c family protein